MVLYMVTTGLFQVLIGYPSLPASFFTKLPVTCANFVLPHTRQPAQTVISNEAQESTGRGSPFLMLYSF
jgi:hypothetical protein